MNRPRLLDLFCGAGGCSVGYHRAGFNVAGVDIEPQPNYPFEFHQADAMTWPLDGFDAIHASPPCQDHSAAAALTGRRHDTAWILAATRDMLRAAGVPWVIENVVGAPMRADFLLCGTIFGLGTGTHELRRHRLFETSGSLFALVPPCQHRRRAICVFGSGGGRDRGIHGRQAGHAEASEALGIDWMTRAELSQAIPPAYTEFIGGQLIEYLAATDSESDAETKIPA